jgi:hypothetical protein
MKKDPVRQEDSGGTANCITTFCVGIRLDIPALSSERCILCSARREACARDAI